MSGALFAAVSAALLALTALVWRERLVRAAMAGWGPPMRRPWAPSLLLSAAIVAATAAAILARASAGPTAPAQSRTTAPAFVMAVDVSRSMTATDVEPNRRHAAIELLRDASSRLDGVPMGLVAFAGEAVLLCPLTLDRAAFAMALDEVELAAADLAGGSRIDAAVAASQNALAGQSPAGFVVLVSDGEQTGGDVWSAVERARRAGIRIHAVGIGTEAGSSIPASRALPQDLAEARTLRVTRLERDTLQRTAEATGGTYVEGSRAAATGVLASMAATAPVTSVRHPAPSAVQWLLAIAFLGLTLEWHVTRWTEH